MRAGEIASAWNRTLRELGYDGDDPHLVDSPARVGRFLTEWDTKTKEPPRLTTFPADGHDELVLTRGIRFYSLCAHHGLPFFGEAAVGYIPHERLIGLSKLARVVDHFARRFQVQERLATDVAALLEDALEPRGIGVVLSAEHLCMAMRGIQRPGHRTVTSVMRGVFRDRAEARAELLSLIVAP